MKGDDLWETPDARAWINDVLTGMAPKMADSVLVTSLVPDDEGDVKFWVELGASIMMNKPLIALVMGNRPIPPKLAAVADEIVRVYGNLNSPGAQRRMAAAVERVMAKTGQGG
jgi:hypothetical protein